MPLDEDRPAGPATIGPPDLHLIELLAADRNLAMDTTQLETAWKVHVNHRGELEHLRTVELDYIPTYIEPATAMQWIENGGRAR